MSVQTVIIILVTFPLVFIGIDIWLFMDRKEGNTYSEILRAAGRKWMPLIMLMSFGFGLLCGHWWW